MYLFNSLVLFLFLGVQTRDVVLQEYDTVFPPICNIPEYTWGEDGRVDQVIQEVRELSECRADPGPRICTQLACADPGVAVFLCNDLDTALEIDCGAAADYAQDIKDRCDNYPATMAESTQGQEFDTGGWNVIVGGTRLGTGGCAV
ncbi:hypothetical protein BJ166DRAFT_587889 [Pestalotiopsis sp. NC0098]|nr:hypothetical protein BJ166DRAFT_587889 [Pestalotiopsis sp. NC0098]